MGLHIHCAAIDIKLDIFSKKSFPIWDHASVRLPGVLSSDITAFEQAHWQV